MAPARSTDKQVLIRNDRGEPRLAWSLDAPAGEIRGSVLITHGLGEHIDRYTEVRDAWVAQGLCVASYDLRGHGHSGGVRGHVHRFFDYVHDAEDMLTVLGQEERWVAGGKPMLFGHSLGGLISAHVALHGQDRYKALLLSSPFLGLLMDVHPLKRLFGLSLSRIYPTFALASGVKGSHVTHDEAMARVYDTDPLILRKVTVGWFTESILAQDELAERHGELTLPIFCLAAGADELVSLPAIQRFIEGASSTDKQLHIIPDRFHEILNETDRAVHIARFADQMIGWG